MKRIGVIIFIILSIIGCSNNSNDNNGNNTNKNPDTNHASIIGKWKLTDGNPVLEGTYISEYFENNTFHQTGIITSFQPSYTCESTANGTYSIDNNIFSYSYLAEKLHDCNPQEYQLMVDSYMGVKELESSQSKIVLLTKKTMIQEHLETKKQITFTRIEE